MFFKKKFRFYFRIAPFHSGKIIKMWYFICFQTARCSQDYMGICPVPNPIWMFLFYLFHFFMFIQIPIHRLFPFCLY